MADVKNFKCNLKMASTPLCCLIGVNNLHKQNIVSVIKGKPHDNEWKLGNICRRNFQEFEINTSESISCHEM